VKISQSLTWHGKYLSIVSWFIHKNFGVIRIVPNTLFWQNNQNKIKKSQNNRQKEKMVIL